MGNDLRTYTAMDEQHNRWGRDIGLSYVDVNGDRNLSSGLVNACLGDLKRRWMRGNTEGFHLWKLYAIDQG